MSNDIEVFPQSIKKISLRYYRQPRSIEASGDNDRTSQYPYFDFTVANGVETYDAANSRDFELPEHYTNDLIIEIASMVGLSIKDQNIQSFFATEEAQKMQE